MSLRRRPMPVGSSPDKACVVQTGRPSHTADRRATAPHRHPSDSVVGALTSARQPLDVAELQGIQRVTAFTLGTALAWIGHDCFGGCPRQTFQLRADIWHLAAPPAPGPNPIFDLVLVRFTETSPATPPLHALLRRVNHCTWKNRIRVREWRPSYGAQHPGRTRANSAPAWVG